ncbi:MAG: calreticulin family protein [Actinomycetota bacterium]|nr:calreticulin family protein [Actinomycetota bacterium]
MIPDPDGLYPADWPHPNTRPCEDCGHVWFAGERRHEYVDPDAKRPEDAQVLCVLCRRQRALARTDA